MSQHSTKLTEGRISFQHTPTGFRIGGVELPRMNGLWCLRQLLMNPGQEISASRLRSEGNELNENPEDLSLIHEFERQPLLSNRDIAKLGDYLEELRSTADRPNVRTALARSHGSLYSI